MSLWKIAWRSIQQRSLASSLTSLNMALGITMVVAVLVMLGVVAEAFTQNPGLGYHLVIGKKGGDYQLVLNTVYHLSRPIENLPYDYYRKFSNEPFSRDELARLFGAGLNDDDPNKFTPEQMQAANSAQRDAAIGRDFTRFQKNQLYLCSHTALKKAWDDWQQRFQDGSLTEKDQNRVTRMNALAKELRTFASRTSRAVPYCLGDNYEGFRVVGTTAAIFDPDFQYANGKTYTFSSGRNFEPEHFFEAVVGATVARKTGLKLGSTFSPTHSFAEDGHVHHDEFKVVGILAPTGTPNDRALFINMEGFYLLEKHAKPVESDGSEPAPAAEKPAEKHDDHDDHAGHDHHHHHGPREPLPENQREVTAILVQTKNDLSAMSLSQKINEGLDAQAASPVRVVNSLFMTFVEPFRLLLLVLTVLIVVVAGVGIMVSIYNSMNERRREIAVMRALGARRSTVMSIILLESIILSLVGGGVGLVAGHLLAWGGSLYMASDIGVTVGPFDTATFELGPFHLGSSPVSIPVPYELLIILGLLLLSTLVGLLPALTAYRTDVSASLNDTA